MRTPSNVTAATEERAEPWNANPGTMNRLGCSQSGLEKAGLPMSMRKSL